MKKIYCAVLTAAIVAATALPAFAVNGHNERRMPMLDVLQRLSNEGYVLREVDFSHGVYHVEAITPKGERVKFNVNARTGQMLNKESLGRRITLIEAVRKASDAGYIRVTKVEKEHGRYIIHAQNRHGRDVLVCIDPKTGELIEKVAAAKKVKK